MISIAGVRFVNQECQSVVSVGRVTQRSQSVMAVGGVNQSCPLVCLLPILVGAVSRGCESVVSVF